MFLNDSFTGFAVGTCVHDGHKGIFATTGNNTSLAQLFGRLQGNAELFGL